MTRITHLASGALTSVIYLDLAHVSNKALPFYFIADVGSFFFEKNWLIQALKIMMILIFIGLALLYLYRMGVHFHWI